MEPAEFDDALYAIRKAHWTAFFKSLEDTIEGTGQENIDAFANAGYDYFFYDL